MKQPLKTLRLICLFTTLTLHTHTASPWGFYTHKQINRLAVFCLPPELFGFFKQNIDYVSEHAVDPDKRRYLVEGEGVKHFIDLDYYEKALPLDTVPRRYQEAVVKFTKDTLHTYGIVPWNIQWKLRLLTEAFAAKNLEQILKQAAEIGHYLGDAHVPLHATSNYNGQKTGQHGIHGFFESRLPELFAHDYDFFLGPAIYLFDPLEAAWLAVEGSFAALDSVFYYEHILQKQFPENQKYRYETKGNALQKMYSPKFSEAYHLALNGMVERRMRAAVSCVASFWYTAWVNAGQPNLEPNNFLNADVAEEKFPEKLPEKMLGREEK